MKKDEALFQVTLTMEGNLKGPLDESHLQPNLKSFYLPSQVALFFFLHFTHIFYQHWHTRRAVNYEKCTFYALVYDNDNCCSSIIFLIKAKQITYNWPQNHNTSTFESTAASLQGPARVSLVSEEWSLPHGPSWSSTPWNHYYDKHPKCLSRGSARKQHHLGLWSTRTSGKAW